MIWYTNTHTYSLIYLPFRELCLLFSSFLFIFLLSLLHRCSKIKKKRAKFVWKTTLWLRKRQLFVLSLNESLLLFIGARQPGQQGRQSYADHIEGLHYLEASYFLFSLKGRVWESISLAKESDGEQRQGGVGEKKCVHKRMRELQNWVYLCGLLRGARQNYTWTASLQLHGGFLLTKWRYVFQCTCVLLRTYVGCTCVHKFMSYICIYMCNVCVYAYLL